MTTEEEKIQQAVAQAREIQQIVDKLGSFASAMEDFSTKFTEHVDLEKPLLNGMRALGDDETVRKRMAFLDLLIKREEQKANLRTAIIQKTFVGALVAIGTYLGIEIIKTVVVILKYIAANPHIGS
ncbi:MAG: hypothetical protein HY661_07660 [Betaproteobacteria bacterium]|nr:hypothetical protein [Betaproteobacteria bacterium]